MNKSYYFEELSSSYDAEIQDLLSDSEGNSAIKARLKEKRQELKAILPMIEFAPEMVVPVFYDAFAFPNTKAMAAAVASEPDDGDFPSWDAISAVVKLESWAEPYAAAVLGEGAGEQFMVTAACLEYIRKFDNAAPAPAAKDDEDARDDEEATSSRHSHSSDDDGDGDEMDLAEAGDDWLGEQGFDSRHS